jgi:hypothetical protein
LRKPAPCQRPLAPGEREHSRERRREHRGLTSLAGKDAPQGMCNGIFSVRSPQGSSWRADARSSPVELHQSEVNRLLSLDHERDLDAWASEGLNRPRAAVALKHPGFRSAPNSPHQPLVPH